MNKLFQLCVLFLFFTAPSFASGNPDYLQLSGYLKNLDGVNAKFVQHTFDGKGTILQTQKGLMKLKFPNMFRWQSTEPYEQLLVSNGKTLWQFDQDLEQVTIQKLDQRLSATPALLLSGSHRDIVKEYDVYAEKLQGEHHFVLIPKSKDVLFDRLRFEFLESGSLNRMIIKDETGQKTIIRILDSQHDKTLSAAEFEFNVPEGIDVIQSE